MFRLMRAGDSVSDNEGGAPPRLRPDMASLRLLVLAFIRNYFVQWGASPSYGEIAAALDTNRTRVRKAVKSLAADGLVIRTLGPRGLALPDSRQAAMRVLRALGWTIDEVTGRATAPGDAPVTNPPLPGGPVLDYLPGHQQGDRDGCTPQEDRAR